MRSVPRSSPSPCWIGAALSVNDSKTLSLACDAMWVFKDVRGLAAAPPEILCGNRCKGVAELISFDVDADR